LIAFAATTFKWEVAFPGSPRGLFDGASSHVIYDGVAPAVPVEQTPP
jgi:hypothetical protein